MNTRMHGAITLLDVPGTYGGPSSRDEVLRALKEALALVQNTAQDAALVWPGLRIEVLDSEPPLNER